MTRDEVLIGQRPKSGDAPSATPEALPVAGGYLVSRNIVTLSEPNGARAEAIRTLRTHIMAQHVEDGRRGLAICAASAKVGCTFTAVNLAVSLSQIGVKVLFIDANLRDPGLDEMIRPPETVKGLQQYLRHDSDRLAGDYIQLEVLPNLALMYAGGVASDAQELLASDQFTNLVDRCLRDFEITIIDTPPANSCADARRISTAVGYSLIVARKNQSFVGDVSALAESLREDRAKVVGTVMNEA